MDFNLDSTVTVYKLNKELYLKSCHSSFEMLIEYGTSVAYDEEHETLYVCVEAMEYPMSEYIKDIMYIYSEEKTYQEYVDEYKERLNQLHADAPVLNKNNTPSEFQPSNPFQRLADLGIQFKIS